MSYTVPATAHNESATICTEVATAHTEVVVAYTACKSRVQDETPARRL